MWKYSPSCTLLDYCISNLDIVWLHTKDAPSYKTISTRWAYISPIAYLPKTISSEEVLWTWLRNIIFYFNELGDIETLRKARRQNRKLGTAHLALLLNHSNRGLEQRGNGWRIILTRCTATWEAISAGPSRAFERVLKEVIILLPRRASRQMGVSSGCAAAGGSPSRCNPPRTSRAGLSFF